jgi:hypothetical protein
MAGLYRTDLFSFPGGLRWAKFQFRAPFCYILAADFFNIFIKKAGYPLHLGERMRIPPLLAHLSPFELS